MWHNAGHSRYAEEAGNWTMRTLSLQAKSDLASTIKHQPPPVHTVPVSPWSTQPSGAGPVIQRKCACGGGCPSCEAETNNLKVQTKLAISSPGDASEREADSVADHVMRMPDPVGQTQRSASNGQAPLIQRQTNGGGGSATVASGFASRLGTGAPLDSASRGYFEPRFGRDFSSVRVHTDDGAARSAASLSARAYTFGNHVVFGAGQWSPATTAGRKLLAHELAHVAQQAGGAGMVQRQMAGEEQGTEQVPPTADKAVPMDEPNKAPGCDDVCGNTAAKCVQGPGEQCSDDMTKKVAAAWQTAANQLTAASDAMAESPLSATTAASLKANFNWSSGNSPADLPTTVANNLSTAATKMSDNLCIKCLSECPKGAKAQITRARGQNCLGSNCFSICPGFAATDTHVLVHELFHRVVSSVEDLYRGQSGYPPPPSMALKMPDSYASLIDDTSAAAAAAAKVKAAGAKKSP